MDERKKLDEAKYFYLRMKEVIGRNMEFVYNLDAFLTAARSAMQFLFEDVKSIPSRKNWYGELYNRYRTLGYFRDKRNYTVHERQLVPQEKVNVTITEVITAVPSVSIEFYRVDSEGNRIEEELDHGNEQSKIHTNKKEDSHDTKQENETGKLIDHTPKSSSTITYEYRFDDWTGPEDILTLSKLYIDDIENLLTEIGK